MRRRLYTVLRTGGEYQPWHVHRLQAQLAAVSDAELVCLSDGPPIPGVTTIPLVYRWPGWWSKMELMGLPDDMVHYTDLDASIVGPVDAFLSMNDLALMRDVYRPRGLQSSLMVLPRAARCTLGNKWMSHPERHMREHSEGGDQALMETLWTESAVRIQDALPGFLVSYKADRVAERGTQGASVVVFHGRPRPWEVGW